MATRPKVRPHLPIIAPEDYRKVAVEYMAEGGGLVAAERRYGEMIASAPDVLTKALASLRSFLPALQLDFTEESLARLDDAIARLPRSGATPPALVDGVAAYLGETLRIALRGHWIVRYDPTAKNGLRASTIHLNPGVAGHAGYECEVFSVAERTVRTRGKELTLGRHFEFARDLMQRRRPEPVRWNGLGCRPALVR